MSHIRHISGPFGIISAVLLSVWYLCAVCGIDIHNDLEHGHVFVVPGFLGFDCNLIHPGQHCFDVAGENGCFGSEECCSDEFSVLLALGEDQDNGADMLPVLVPIAYVAQYSRSACAGTSSGVTGIWTKAPPAPLSSRSRSSVLRI